jgi:hypothetical protein
MVTTKPMWWHNHSCSANLAAPFATAIVAKVKTKAALSAG